MERTVPSKRQIASIVKRLQTQKAKVAKARDNLNEIYDEIESFKEAWTDADENLMYAIDRLSELL